jgi:GTP-binding protein EngB required for normal cell division
MDEEKLDQYLASLSQRKSIPNTAPPPETPSKSAEESFFEEIKQDLDESELAKIQEKAKARGFSFLLVGRTGVGKSSTINSLMGREIAPVGEFEPETKVVKAYPAPPNAIIPYRIYDTPGLCDADGDNEKYLKLIHAQIKEPIDCLWFVTQLDDSRVRTDEIDTIRHTTSAFGKDIWKRAVIVFTRADNVKHEKFDNTLSKRTSLIRDEIAKEIGNEIALEIPSVAITNESDKTPDGKLWLGRLFVKTFVRISEEGLDGFLLEIVNWRGLHFEGDEIQKNRPQSQDRPINNYYYRTVNKTIVKPDNNSQSSSNARPDLIVTKEDRITTPEFDPRAETWFQRTGRNIGENVGKTVTENISKIIPVSSDAQNYIRQGAGNIGAGVATVIQDAGTQVRNVWNSFTGLFR